MAITFPLVFGWIAFRSRPDDQMTYITYLFGFPAGQSHLGTVLARSSIPPKTAAWNARAIRAISRSMTAPYYRARPTRPLPKVILERRRPELIAIRMQQSQEGR